MTSRIVTNVLGNGTVITKNYNNNDQLHNENGPAIKTHFSEEWYINGKQHRKDGYAVLIKKDDYIRAEWWQEGVLHRENKPAIIDSEGVIEYWEKGIKIDK